MITFSGKLELQYQFQADGWVKKGQKFVHVVCEQNLSNDFLA